MLEELKKIEINAREALDSADTEVALQQWYSKRLGRKSALMSVFNSMGTLSKEERPQIGRRANEVK